MFARLLIAMWGWISDFAHKAFSSRGGWEKDWVFGTPDPTLVRGNGRAHPITLTVLIFAVILDARSLSSHDQEHSLIRVQSWVRARGVVRDFRVFGVEGYRQRSARSEG